MKKNTLARTTEEFIVESINIWGKKYDYGKVEYINANTKVIIGLNGVFFEQIPSSHLLKIKVEDKIQTTDEFVRRSKLVHGEKYNYSKSIYVGSKIGVIIIYNEKEYIQTPTNHLSGNCPENLTFARKNTTSEFIEKSIKIHTTRYDYSKVDYINTKTKVIIICKIHGEFNQAPRLHLSGSGCTHCGNSKEEKAINRTKRISQNELSQ